MREEEGFGGPCEWLGRGELTLGTVPSRAAGLLGGGWRPAVRPARRAGWGEPHRAAPSPMSRSPRDGRPATPGPPAALRRARDREAFKVPDDRAHVPDQLVDRRRLRIERLADHGAGLWVRLIRGRDRDDLRVDGDRGERPPRAPPDRPRPRTPGTSRRPIRRGRRHRAPTDGWRCRSQERPRGRDGPRPSGRTRSCCILGALGDGVPSVQSNRGPTPERASNACVSPPRSPRARARSAQPRPLIDRSAPASPPRAARPAPAAKGDAQRTVRAGARRARAEPLLGLEHGRHVARVLT